MRVVVTVGHDEVLEALREWLDKRGVPVVAVDKLVVDAKSGGNYTFLNVTELRATVQYECDAIGTGEARAVPEPVANSKKRLGGPNVYNPDNE